MQFLSVAMPHLAGSSDAAAPTAADAVLALLVDRMHNQPKLTEDMLDDGSAASNVSPCARSRDSVTTAVLLTLNAFALATQVRMLLFQRLSPMLVLKVFPQELLNVPVLQKVCVCACGKRKLFLPSPSRPNKCWLRLDSFWNNAGWSVFQSPLRARALSCWVDDRPSERPVSDYNPTNVTSTLILMELMVMLISVAVFSTGMSF